jgi:Co/Zn/Cd efflux system component
VFSEAWRLGVNLHFMKISTENDNNFGYEKITILGVLVSTVLALVVFDYHVLEKGAVFNQNLYTWMQIGGRNQNHPHD